MTVVCCWLDDSYGRRRITAIADARAAIQDSSGRWAPLNEETTKLYRMRVSCYRISGFDTVRGLWSDPYYTTEIGIGFAGYCFEAMSIIALFQRCVDQLVVDADDDAMPAPSRLTSMLAEISSRWFRRHQDANRQYVEFLIFGFSPDTGEPWAAKVIHRGSSSTQLAEFSCPLETESTYLIGDVGQQPKFRTAVERIRKQIKRHAKRLRKGSDIDELHEYELEVARHTSAEKKSLEQAVIDEMENEFQTTVGGVLQKMEVIASEGNRAAASFSRNDQHHLLDMLPSAGDRLVYIPIAEKMGWP